MDKKQMWIDWTHDALSGYSPGDLDADELADDMAEVATKYADAMTEEFEERFGSGSPRGRRKKTVKED